MKFEEMEAKLLEEKLEKMKEKEMEKEKEEEEEEVVKDDARSENVPEVNENPDENEVVSSESIDKPTPVESFSTDDGIYYTPGPIRVPTEEPLVTRAEHVTSELPPIPQTIVEQERIEMVEINNDGTSGHLSHSIE